MEFVWKNKIISILYDINTMTNYIIHYVMGYCSVIEYDSLGSC